MASLEEGPADPSVSAGGGPLELVMNIKEEPPSSQQETDPHQMQAGGEPSGKGDTGREDKTVERKRATKRSPISENIISLPGLLIYKEFCLEMSISTDITEIPVEQLAANLQKFFFYVRLNPASVLQQLFDQVCLVVEFYRQIRIRKDPRFRKVVRVCQGRLESLDGEGSGSFSGTPQITEQLSMFCLRKLLFCAELRPDHPTGLFNLTLLYMMVYMCKETTHWTEMKALLASMRRSSFVCRTDISNNLKYITFRREHGCIAARIYEVPGHPICPFKIVRLYMSKLSTSSSYLWQRPKNHARPNETWFYPDASNTINNEWLLKMTEQASMTVSYTNMSLVLTPRSVMDATLADPVFAQTIADEVPNIPEPPKYDASKLESALPGGQEKLEIRLLSSSEAQVEIRLTEILWKELFPEWDRARLESGYQNHVDFMHHLLDVHKSCRADRCRSLEAEMMESEPAPLAEKPLNTPINVAQHGIHNSSVLTVVNNNTIPQSIPGAQNVIVPLNDLLKSLGASTGLTAGQTAIDAASNQIGASGGVVNNRMPSHTLQQNGTLGKLPPSQLELSQQLVQNASILNQLGSTPVVLPAHTPGTPSTPVVQPGTITGLMGSNIPPPPQGTNAFTQGFQSVLSNLQPDQGLTSNLDLVQAASILAAASQPASSVLTSSVGLQQAAAGLPVSTLLKISNAGMPSAQQEAAGVVPSGLLDTVANAAALSAPQNLLQAAGDVTPGVVSSPLQASQVVDQKGTPSSLMTTQLDALAEGNPTGSTFVITSQGIVALPSLQQQQPAQTVISGLSNPGTVVNAADVSMNTSAATASKTDGVKDSSRLSHENKTTSDPQLATTISGVPTHTASSHQCETSGTLDLSMKSSQQKIPSQGAATTEAPLDLSVNKSDTAVKAASEIIPSTVVSRKVVSVNKERTQHSNVQELNGALHAAVHLPGASAPEHIPAAVRSPPPPYPGASPRLDAARQSGVQPGYPRFVNEPSSDLQGFLNVTSLKRKGTTGKSVRELLDRKRRNNARNSPNGTPEFRRSIFLNQGLPAVVKSVSLAQGVKIASTQSRVCEANVSIDIQEGLKPVENHPLSLAGPSELHRQSPGGLSGRKSRRKPQQVFRRMVVRVKEEASEDGAV